MEQSIAILILFYNKLDQTKDCINSFLPSGQKIYVLNNGSEETQWSNLKSSFINRSNLLLLDAGKNLGVSGGRNYLIKSSKADWFFMVDNDITIKSPETWVEIIKEKIKQNPRADAFIPKMYNRHENEYACNYNMVIKDGKLFGELCDGNEINNFPGGAALVSRNVFSKFGLYDEQMFVGFEDFEFAIRGLLSKVHEPIRAILIDEFELIHDHKIQIKKADKKAKHFSIALLFVG